MRRAAFVACACTAMVAIAAPPAMAFKMLKSEREAANDAKAVAPGIQKGQRGMAAPTPAGKAKAAPQPKDSNAR